MGTDSLTNPAEINIAAGAEININIGDVNNGFIPNLPENYGNLILADPLQITHQGSGILIFSRPIVEAAEPTGVTIHEDTTGTVSFLGANTYTGPTTVNAGTLLLRNGEAISDVATLALNGTALVNIDTTETVGNLFIDGLRKAPGIYGSSLSAAPVENQDDTKFSGIGTLTVAGAPIESGEIKIVSIQKTATSITLTWTSNPGETYSVFTSPDLENFDAELEDGIPAAADDSVTEYTIPLNFLGDPEKAFFRVVVN